MGRNLGFAGGGQRRRRRGERRPPRDPQPRRDARCPDGARRSAGPGSRAAAGRPGRRWSPSATGRRSTPPATRSTSPGSSGPGCTASRSARRPPPGEVTALSGACLAVPLAGLAAARRLCRALLHVPRGRRPLAAAAAGGGDAGDRAGGGRRPRLRVHRLGRQQVALAGAQPAGHPGPRLPGRAARCCWRRRCWRPRWRWSPPRRRGGWGGQKLRADAEFDRWLPRLLRERREIQRTRAVSAGDFASSLTADLDSPFIPAVARSGPARLALRAYWRLVRALLGR